MNVNGSWKMNQFVNQPGLHVADRHQIHRAGDQHRHDDAHAQRHFVADDLGRFTHRAEQRPLRRRRIAGEDDAEHFEPQHGQDEEHADVQFARATQPSANGRAM